MGNTSSSSTNYGRSTSRRAPGDLGGGVTTRALALFSSYDVNQEGVVSRSDLVCAVGDFGLLNGLTTKKLCAAITKALTKQGVRTDTANEIVSQQQFMNVLGTVAEKLGTKAEAVPRQAALTDASVQEHLRRVFVRCCKRDEPISENGREAEVARLTSSLFMKLLGESGFLVPSGQVSFIVAEVLFARAKPKGARRLHFVDFLKLVEDLATETGMDLASCAKKLRAPSSQGSEAGSVTGTAVASTGLIFGSNSEAPRVLSSAGTSARQTVDKGPASPGAGVNADPSAEFNLDDSYAPFSYSTGGIDSPGSVGKYASKNGAPTFGLRPASVEELNRKMSGLPPIKTGSAGPAAGLPIGSTGLETRGSRSSNSATFEAGRPESQTVSMEVAGDVFLGGGNLPGSQSSSRHGTASQDLRRQCSLKRLGNDDLQGLIAQPQVPSTAGTQRSGPLSGNGGLSGGSGRGDAGPQSPPASSMNKLLGSMAAPRMFLSVSNEPHKSGGLEEGDTLGEVPEDAPARVRLIAERIKALEKRMGLTSSTTLTSDSSLGGSSTTTLSLPNSADSLGAQLQVRLAKRLEAVAKGGDSGKLRRSNAASPTLNSVLSPGSSSHSLPPVNHASCPELQHQLSSGNLSSTTFLPWLSFPPPPGSVSDRSPAGTPTKSTGYGQSSSSGGMAGGRIKLSTHCVLDPRTPGTTTSGLGKSSTPAGTPGFSIPGPSGSSGAGSAWLPPSAAP